MISTCVNYQWMCIFDDNVIGICILFVGGDPSLDVLGEEKIMRR